VGLSLRDQGSWGSKSFRSSGGRRNLKYRGGRAMGGGDYLFTDVLANWLNQKKGPRRESGSLV